MGKSWDIRKILGFKKASLFVKLIAKLRSGRRLAPSEKKEILNDLSLLALAKSPNNPIIEPKKENSWEAWQTFNPGVVLLKDRVHFLYRAIGEDGLSRLGYAFSDNGFVVDRRLDYPSYEHPAIDENYSCYSFASGGSWGGCEDPRLVRVDQEEVIYMTYTACDRGLRVALTSIKMEDFLGKKWRWKKPILISPPGQIHKNWVIFPEKIRGKYAVLHSISPRISIDYLDSLDFKERNCLNSHYKVKLRKDCWDSWLRGAGPPPLKTEKGWLLLYHAMDQLDPGKYKVGAMLLDLEDPSQVLCRSQEPVLEPSEEYENIGFKTQVVYASGAVVKDENLLVYYGGADSYVCVAYANFSEFLTALAKDLKPKLKAKILKKK
ncbi:MAG: hypothetical protein ABIB61_03120 [Candidatus Shapirobacteria bacterium]